MSEDTITTLFLWVVISIAIISVASCNAFESYQNNLTQRELVKRGYVQRVDHGNWIWVKDKEAQ